MDEFPRGRDNQELNCDKLLESSASIKISFNTNCTFSAQQFFRSNVFVSLIIPQDSIIYWVIFHRGNRKTAIAEKAVILRCWLCLFFFILSSTIQFAEFNVLNSVKILQKKKEKKNTEYCKNKKILMPSPLWKHCRISPIWPI